MKTLKQIERLRKAHQLISTENTGTPKEFATKLHISERQLYLVLEQLKEMDAPLLFNKKSTTYYYCSHFELLINVSVKVLMHDELKTIYAGSTKLTENFMTARLLQ